VLLDSIPSVEGCARLVVSLTALRAANGARARVSPPDDDDDDEDDDDEDDDEDAGERRELRTSERRERACCARLG